MKSQSGGTPKKPVSVGKEKPKKAGGDSACGISDMRGGIAQPHAYGVGLTRKGR